MTARNPNVCSEFEAQQTVVPDYYPEQLKRDIANRQIGAINNSGAGYVYIGDVPTLDPVWSYATPPPVKLFHISATTYSEWQRAREESFNYLKNKLSKSPVDVELNLLRARVEEFTLK